MKLYRNNSRGMFVNLFADFIITKLDPNNKLSQIQVTDCNNFLVIGGLTESENILNLMDIKSEFAIKYKKLFKKISIDKLNLIDLIVYNKKPIISEIITFGNFYNSVRPIYNSIQIESEDENEVYNDYLDDLNSTSSLNEPLHISSEFPFGYSLNNQRDKFYYSEYVSYNLMTIIGITKIKLTWENNNVKLISDSFIENDHIESLMLDVFDFNIEKFNKKIKEYHLLDDILFPIDKKPWLVKDKTNELFIT